MNVNEREALKAFLLDTNCLKRLDAWTDDLNIFDILKITNMEIRHSNILAWLFDPNENHFMGDAFIKEFISKVVEKSNHEKHDPFKLLLQDYFTYQVYREANHMDIVLVSKEEKTAIIIENKVWSGESSHQLKDYMERSKVDYSECDQILYIFLTPNGCDSSDPDNWISMSYEEIIEALESATKGIPLRTEVALIVRNYIEIVRKNIMKERDEELVRLCNDIYNKHRTALRLIFENVKIDNSVDSEIICTTLEELSKENKIVYEGNNSWSFFTNDMTAFLPPLEEAKSSWGTNCIYWYWFEKSGEYLEIHLELGRWNISSEALNHMNALIDAAKKKRDPFERFKRIYFNKAKLSQENYEKSLKDAVRKLVTAALKNEKEILEKAKSFLNI